MRGCLLVCLCLLSCTQPEQHGNQSWALDRIDQRELPLDGVRVPRGLGGGVNVYLLDTGVDRDALAGQLASLPDQETGDFVHDTPDATSDTDCQGHGTHLAGLVVGRETGVASAARLFSLRVAGCTGRGTPRASIEALRWLEKHAVAPSVVLMSLQYRDAPELGPLVTRLIDAGHVVVTAAGETLEDACTLQPSGADGVLSIAAVDSDDVARERSNWGRCISMWAPGSEISSLGPSNASVTKSGSSVAAALVAGAAAIYLSSHPLASAADVKAALLEEASRDGVRIARALHASQTTHRQLFVPEAWYRR